jgi:hypothetical protein
MTSLTNSTRFAIVIALSVSFMGSLWLMAVPDVVTLSTFALFAALLTALAAITLNTYKNGQPTSSMAQLLNETENARSSTTVSVPGATSRTRSQG